MYSEMSFFFFFNFYKSFISMKNIKNKKDFLLKKNEKKIWIFEKYVLLEFINIGRSKKKIKNNPDPKCFLLICEDRVKKKRVKKWNS